jgi:hypothetical protein
MERKAHLPEQLARYAKAHFAVKAIGTRNLERAKGIEPSYAAWEAAVLPLNYARTVFFLAPDALSLHIKLPQAICGIFFHLTLLPSHFARLKRDEISRCNGQRFDNSQLFHVNIRSLQ